MTAPRGADRDQGTGAMRTKVMSAHQSPMNPVRWFLTLACGHDAWVTSKRRPTAKTHECRVCEVPQ